MLPRRVIQFSTGNVGRHALQAIIGRPDLELVGVHAAGNDKVGRDAAELCGLGEPTGVTATNDIDALVALGADCVVYTSQAETRPHDAIEEITRFLRAGTNVVGTSLVWLVAPQHADSWLRTPLEQACAAGGTSLYINGIDPGFSGDTLVYTALSLTSHAIAITVQEIFDYGSYDDAEFTGASFGFGTTPDHTPIMFQPGVLSSLWGGQVRSLATDLGIELDEVRERHESWVTPQRIDCAMMRVPPGHVAAVRFAVEGLRAENAGSPWNTSTSSPQQLHHTGRIRRRTVLAYIASSSRETPVSRSTPTSDLPASTTTKPASPLPRHARSMPSKRSAAHPPDCSPRTICARSTTPEALCGDKFDALVRRIVAGIRHRPTLSGIATGPALLLHQTDRSDPGELMARIVVIGGHGKVALHLSRILSQRGDEVSSVFRNPDHTDDVVATGATPVVADIERLDTDALAQLLAGHDAVVFSAGAGGGNPARTYAVDRDAAIRVIDAAGRAGVPRFVMVSYFGARPDHGVPQDDPFFPYAEAKAAADAHLRASDLDWTVLGPGRLTLDPATGRIALGPEAAKGQVSREDVALVIAAVLAADSTIGRTIEFNNGDVPIAEALTAER